MSQVLPNTVAVGAAARPRAIVRLVPGGLLVTREKPALPRPIGAGGFTLRPELNGWRPR